MLVRRKTRGVAVPDMVKGQAALSLVLLISSIVLLSGLALLFLVNSFTNATLGFRAANRALAVASAGADDVLLRIVRDVGFNDCLAAAPCEVVIGNDKAVVTVTNDYPSGIPRVVILSEARVLNYRRKIQVEVSIDPSTGRIAVESWEQLPL